MNAEDAYKVFTDYALFRGGQYVWERFVLSIDIFEAGGNFSHYMYDGTKKFQSKIPVPMEADFAVSDAAVFLRDDLLASSGERIWRLEFVLQNDGKFNITYDYNAPEWVNS